MKINFIGLFLAFFFISSPVLSQTILTGKVLDENLKPLAGATVIVNIDTTDAVAAYSFTNNDGKFKIVLKKITEKYSLKVSYVGYKKWHEQLQNENNNLEISLSPTTEEIKEVLIESKYLEQRGDTLSYLVSEFKDQEDRVISDVLEKMPGIQILSNGEIRYQGKPIEKYYIEGLDLLEGRYNLANRSLSANDVYQVEVLENHQPIKILDSLEFSERASLNIKLKKEVTMSGMAEIGAGLSPFLWKTKITPMLFTKKNQAIISYQSNNTGTDASSDITDFSLVDLGREELDINRKNWISVRQLAPPPFEQERWLNNNIHLGSLNYLIRLEDDIDLKLGISYVNDTQKQIGKTLTHFFTTTDRIDLNETIVNDLYINTFRSKFILERNTEKKYFKNQLEINGDFDSQRGQVKTKNDTIEQALLDQFSIIRNKFTLLHPLGNQVVKIRSNSGYTREKQNLGIWPGQFEDFISKGLDYQRTSQNLDMTTFFIENSAGISKDIKGVTVSPELGVSLSKQEVQSQLKAIGIKVSDYSNAWLTNDISLGISRFFAFTRFVYKTKGWNFRLTTPLNYHMISMDDFNNNNHQKINRFTFEPSIFINKELSTFWETSLSVNFTNDFGNIQHMHEGLILKNYRSLHHYESAISESFKQYYNAGFKFRKPVKAIFVNGSYSYSIITNNLAYTTTIDENGIGVYGVKKRLNYSSSHNFLLEGSKYFRKLGSTLNLGMSYSIENRKEFLNDKFTPVERQGIVLDLGLEAEITEQLSASYSLNYTLFQTHLEDEILSTIQNQEHQIGIYYYISDNQYINVNSDYYFNEVSLVKDNTGFINLLYQYTFERTGIDLEARWINILNNDTYVKILNTDLSYIQSTYQIRPSQVIIGLKFSF